MSVRANYAMRQIPAILDHDRASVVLQCVFVWYTSEFVLMLRMKMMRIRGGEGGCGEGNGGRYHGDDGQEDDGDDADDDDGDLDVDSQG